MDLDYEKSESPLNILQPILQMKKIRKDVFHYLKAVLEEARIFLPMKLPEIPAIEYRELPELPASQTLANLHQQAIMNLEPAPMSEVLPQMEMCSTQPPIGKVIYNHLVT